MIRIVRPAASGAGIEKEPLAWMKNSSALGSSLDPSCGTMYWSASCIHRASRPRFGSQYSCHGRSRTCRVTGGVCASLRAAWTQPKDRTRARETPGAIARLDDETAEVRVLFMQHRSTCPARPARPAFPTLDPTRTRPPPSSGSCRRAAFPRVPQQTHGWLLSPPD